MSQVFKPRITERFPEEKRPKPLRFHGRHVLNRYEDGMEKCIGCELCAGVCPARCIYVRGADNPPDAPIAPGERYGFVYEINYLRCIHCDLCVEACPTEAITETNLFEFSFARRQDAWLSKGKIVPAKTILPTVGELVFIQDPEGNVIGAMKYEKKWKRSCGFRCGSIGNLWLPQRVVKPKCEPAHDATRWLDQAQRIPKGTL